MAAAECMCPLGLGLVLLSTSVGGRRQRRARRKPLCSRVLAWGNSWGVPLRLHQVALAGSGVGLVKNVLGLGGQKRLYPHDQNRIAASSNASSSSSFPGSSGVDRPAQAHSGRVEAWEDQYGEDGRAMQFEMQSSLIESSGSSSGGWESEQGHVEAEFGDKDQGISNAYNGSSREVVGEDTAGDTGVYPWEGLGEGSSSDGTSSSSPSLSTATSGPSLVGAKEPVYEVIEVSQIGEAVKKLVSRRQLLRTSGLRLRDLRRVDPSLWVTNSAPALQIRDEAILLNLGSLRAISTTQEVLIFDHESVGAKALIDTLIPRLNDRNNGSSPIMPFVLEVIESALISRTQRVERALMDVEPRVLALLEVLPTRMTADVLEDLRVCKQTLVEVGAKAGALRQMLLELLEHPQDIRRMVIMGRICSIHKDDGGVYCEAPQDKQVAEDEEEEMEMLLEYYLQRCESCHGQALKLLSSAKEMEDSIAVNLSSRRLEVSRLELLLQVGTFCAALGALIAGIFGMNLKSYLEERALAFWITTGGIIFGGVALFLYMFSYLRNRKIL